MNASSAVTISRAAEDVIALIGQAEPPLSDEDAEVLYDAAPGGRGTEVRVRLDREVPGGALREKVAAVVGSDLQRQLDDALRRFKQLVEAGEVARSDGSPEGTDAQRQRKQRPAEPVDAGE